MVRRVGNWEKGLQQHAATELRTHNLPLLGVGGRKKAFGNGGALVRGLE